MDQDQASVGADLQRRLDHYVRPGIPKYMAMRDAIAHAVADGSWLPGLRLPTEVEWAATLPLSVGTIQRALRMLVDEGIIVRQQGSGTFVAGQPDESMHAPLHCRFIDGSGTGYLPVYPKITDRYDVAEAGPWTDHLRCERTLCIERVLAIGDEFSVFSRFYADPQRLSAFQALPLKKLATENFKELIMRETAQAIGRMDQYLSVRRFEPAVCKAIAVRSGTSGQKLDIRAYVGKGSPVYYQELFIPPNERVLHLARDGRDRGLADS
ncbi:MAG TPA: GntR family transcriptional regulator [Bordetella sp.]|nr:GntR family transcriptional regulator [Bordetella sp.]